MAPADAPATRPKNQNKSLYQRLSLAGTWLTTLLSGKAIGQDRLGNRYYETKKPGRYGRTRRWVIYAGVPEASRVPPEWHGWLHHTHAHPLPENGPTSQPWQLPAQENLTGGPDAWVPPGSQANRVTGGQRPRATGDYEAWTPGE